MSLTCRVPKFSRPYPGTRNRALGLDRDVDPGPRWHPDRPDRDSRRSPSPPRPAIGVTAKMTNSMRHSGRLELVSQRRNRLADCVFVRCTIKEEVREPLVVPGPAVQLCEASPGHRFGVGDDMGFQRPAADLATVAAKQPCVAGLRPLSSLLSEEVSRQIAKAEWSGTRPA
jgi:hypothetical protein